MDSEQIRELLLQSLEHERGGVKIYATALQCVINEDLRQQFQKYLTQTRSHERILMELCDELGFDPNNPVIYGPDEQFVVGKAKIVRQSNNDLVLVVAARVTLFEALKAYDELMSAGIQIRVIDLFSI